MSRFVIREVREGPEELRKHLPITGETFDVRSGPDGHTYFCARLDEPIKHRLDASIVATGHAPEQLESGTAGSNLTVSGIVMRPSDPDAQPYHGMQHFPVELAYVIDPAYGDEPELAFDKLLPIATVEIDDLAENHPERGGEPRDHGQETTAIAGQLEDNPTPASRAAHRDADPHDRRPPQANSAGTFATAPEPGEPPPFHGLPQADGPRFSRANYAPLPPQHVAETPLLATTLKRATPPKKVAAMVAAACVGATLIAITVWNCFTPESSQPAAVEPTPSAAEIERAKSALPRGYSDNSCKPVSGSADPSLTCGPNSDPGGPRSATYTIYPNQQALSEAFAAAIATYTRVNCPGNIQSPGPWRRNATRGKAVGNLFCGIRNGQDAAVVWTDDAKHMLHIAETGPQGANLDPLYSWWGTHA